MQHIITITVVLISIGNCECYTHRYNESIFIYDKIKKYCDMKCGDHPHTLCQDERIAGTPPPKCSDDFFTYNLTSLRDDILSGFNGLRSRIAEKMQVSNMNLLTWDEELSLMAQLFLRHCDPFKKNPCTNLGRPSVDAPSKEPRYFHISENGAYIKSQFYPYHFAASVLRDWYYGKNYMEPPKIYTTQFDDLYGILVGHNNFTRVANPRVSRVGCGIARFHEGFSMLCYFFPYYQSNVHFDRGPPATNCPNLFPLKGVIFPNLCTSRADVMTGLFNYFWCCLYILLYCGDTYWYRVFRLHVQGDLIFWQKWNW